MSDIRLPLTFKGEVMIRTLRMFDVGGKRKTNKESRKGIADIEGKATMGSGE